MTTRSIHHKILGSQLLWLISRLLLAVVFLSSGLAKLMNFDGGVQEVQQLGLTPPALWSILVIITLIGGSVLILLDRYMWLAAVVLGGFLALAILLVHHFWSLPHPRSISSMYVALEHISLIGGLLAAAIASYVRAQSAQG